MVQIHSPRPKHLAYFLWLIKRPLHPKLHCGILPDRRSGVTSRLIFMSSLHAEYVENAGRQECYSEIVEQRQVRCAVLIISEYGEPCTFLVSSISRLACSVDRRNINPFYHSRGFSLRSRNPWSLVSSRTTNPIPRTVLISFFSYRPSTFPRQPGHMNVDNPAHLCDGSPI